MVPEEIWDQWVDTPAVVLCAQLMLSLKITPLVLSFACVAGLGPPFGMRLVPAQAASVKLQAASHKLVDKRQAQ